MSRLIEYRAWDKEDKKMIDCVDLGVLSAFLNKDYNDPKTNPFEFMQFTGLVDRKRNKIYEGDIIQENSYNPYFRGKIEWGGKWKSCGFVITGIEPWANGRVEYSDDKLNEAWSGEWIEVIGNIYQNPELLK